MPKTASPEAPPMAAPPQEAKIILGAEMRFDQLTQEIEAEKKKANAAYEDLDSRSAQGEPDLEQALKDAHDKATAYGNMAIAFRQGSPEAAVAYLRGLLGGSSDFGKMKARELIKQLSGDA